MFMFTRSGKGQLNRKQRRSISRRARRAGLILFMAPALISGMLVTAATVSTAAGPVGAGFTITKGDISFILEQIRIAEAHAATTNATTGPCGSLIGPGAYQLAHAGLPFGLRTVDGSCNNLIQGQSYFGSAAGYESNPAASGDPAVYDYLPILFPRFAAPVYRDAAGPVLFPTPGTNTYDTTNPAEMVFDSAPRLISNLIVDQTATNPAAIAAAGSPLRAQNAGGVFPCDAFGMPIGCVPAGKTLFIENVTTDVGLSPPYNSLFTLFGQFFDHGIDQTVKGGGTVFVPLAADDPLRTHGPDGILGNGDEVPPHMAFMVLSRGRNQPGPNGILGDADDIRDAPNTDSPWVDQSQTYASHPSHQVFLRHYEMVGGVPVSTGNLLDGRQPGDPELDLAGNHIDYGMATWETTKRQAAEKLGLFLKDKDVLEVPMLATDAYGNFTPGPLRGLPQYVTATGLVEGDLTTPVPVPTNVLKNDRPFLTDLAHHASPLASNGTPLAPDVDTVATGNFAVHKALYPLGGVYDDEMLNAHFIAGDGRVNENIGLITIHQVFHSEHDRVANEVDAIIQSDPVLLAAFNEEFLPGTAIPAWDYGERLFQVARFVTEMEYQHLVFEDFVRKMQPGLNPFTPAALIETSFNPAIKAEFAHAVYRFGHSMLTETIDRKNVDGSPNNIPLLDGFLNPPEYFNGGTAGPLNAHQAAGAVIMGMSDQAGNELDEFVTNTLRNNLLGLPLDLASLNIARGRSEGVPPLNVFRRDLYNQTLNGELKPYTSWVDFGQNIKHPASLINFVAAYGQHPTIIGATTAAAKREAARLIVNPDPFLGDIPPADAMAFLNSTGAWANVGTTSVTGLDEIDLWVGGLAEITSPFGGLLGTTMNFVFESQMTDLQNGDRFYYLTRTPGMNFRAQLEGNSFTELLQRTTESHTLKADAFATADCKFELANLQGTPAGFALNGNLVANDPLSDCDESALLLRKPDGTIQYRAYNTVDPLGINGQSVYNGTSGVDRMWGGNDNDTFWGGAANDIIEGGFGADIALGGEGNDIITDIGGDDIPKGGPGNDAIDAGPGLDIVLAGDGKDFALGGINADEIFGGSGDDFISGGEGTDGALGDDGDDWIQGGAMQDLLIGDSSNFFFQDNTSMPGSDILIGQSGDDDYDMEGGDDVGVAGPGIEKNAGQSGWDWFIAGSPGQGGDMAPLFADLQLPIVNQNIFVVDTRDRFDEVEALSGGQLDDVLLGDNIVPINVINLGGTIGKDWITPATLLLFSGLQAVLPPGTVVDATTFWGAGNIILGGGGNDTMTGRGADDVIDGDRYLNVRLSVRTNPAVPSTQIGTTDLMENTYQVGNPMTLQQAVFAGIIDPGNIVAVREILVANAATSNADVAVFKGALAEYDITFVGDAVIVNHARPAAGIPDGIDTVRNVEVLRFLNNTTLLAPVAPTDLNLIAPAAPSITSVTGGSGQATVGFAPAAANGGPAVTSFEIVVRNVATLVETTITGISSTATSQVITGLTNGASYQFAVRAVNPVGASPLSAFSATVVPVLDVIAPTVTAQTPLPGSVGLALDANLTATISEPVLGVSGTTVTLRLGTSVLDTLIPRVVTYNSGTGVITINPNVNLLPGTEYTVRLLSGITDLAGNPLAPTSWSFTTAGSPPAPVNPAPTVASSTPVANSIGALRNSNLTVNFSEAVTGVSAATVVVQRVSNNTTVVGAITLDGTGQVLTINPAGRLRANTLYRVTLTGGAAAIRDLAGAPLVTTTWTFTTGPN